MTQIRAEYAIGPSLRREQTSASVAHVYDERAEVGEVDWRLMKTSERLDRNQMENRKFPLQPTCAGPHPKSGLV